jgi:four helix bundle protein
MEPVRDFMELRVYRSAFAGASEIFRMARRFPPEERYSLTDQIRRSSRSVCANIAEAWQKRRYPASFVSKLCDADGEAAETLFWLAAALDCGYIDGGSHGALHGRYKHIGATWAHDG